MNLKDLQKKYPIFIYESYSCEISGKNLKVFFNFKISDISFKPEIIIENIDSKLIKKVGESALSNLIFNLGLMEIPSYWKTTCSPEIIIKAGPLTAEQIRWWKNLIIDGMGQFFYENKIDWRKKNFLKISCPNKSLLFKAYPEKLKNKYLVPFAGGRDSIVTLENLKKQKKEISLFTVNPIEKIQRTVKVSKIKSQITVRRKIDKTLLDLNKKGYLNGHTPFTGLLSFLSVLCAVIFNCKNIAFSNEKSSNEGNVKYLGRVINHQWAKSSEFEKTFKVYSKKYLARDINYFSYLRKYTELEISEMLSKYPQYFPVFSSCNAGMRINAKGTLRAKERWCRKCPKCLFVFLSLYPFLNENDLLKIFGKNLFEDKSLLLLFRQLIEKKGIKPFECVGTKKETLMALNLAVKKAKSSNKIPFLLKALRL